MKSITQTILLVSALALLLASSALAGGNFQLLIRDNNDTGDRADDILRQTITRWPDERIPVFFVAYAPGAIIPPTITAEPYTNFDVLQAYRRSVENWNDADLLGNGGAHDFEFTPFIAESGFYGSWFSSLNPFGLVLFDGFNTITYYDVPLSFQPSVLGLTPAFVALEDFDLSDLVNPGFFVDVDFIGDQTGDLNPIGLDDDGDGVAEILFWTTEFKAGDYIDSDVAMSQLFLWNIFPEDEDDIPGGEEYLGIPDVEAILTHELGHGIGLVHTYLFDSTMFPVFFNGVTNPYDVRRPQFDDVIGLVEAYGGGMGEISGSLISGAGGGNVAQPVTATNPNNDADLFRVPVFLGVFDDTVNLTDPNDLGFVPRGVVSDDGIVRLLGSVFSGQDTVWYDTIPFAAPNVNVFAPLNKNGEFSFNGLPDDTYVLYITPAATAAYDYVKLILGDFEAFEAEFYGGAPITDVVPGNGTDDNNLNDNTFESNRIQVAINAFGQFTIGYNDGPSLLFGHGNDPIPATSYTTVRVMNGGVPTDYSNRLDGEGFPSTVETLAISDAGNQARLTWEVPPGIQVTQQIRIFGDGTTIAERGAQDDIEVRYDVTNVSGFDQQVGVRVLLDTIINDDDNVPFVISGEEYISGTDFTGASVPGLVELNGRRYPKINLAMRLSLEEMIGSTTTRYQADRFAVGFFPDFFFSNWDLNTSREFAGLDQSDADGSAAVYWNPGVVPAGATVTHKFLISPGTAADSQPEVGDSRDDPTDSEPIVISGGNAVRDLAFITNTGSPPTTGGVVTGEGIQGTGALFGSPSAPGGTVFPTDLDASIGIDVGDVDRDGDLDLVFANTLTSGGAPSAQINRLYLNGGFEDNGFSNSLPLGDFVDVTFGRDHISNGPAALGMGDDLLPTVADIDPLTPGFQSELVNDSTSCVNLADFDGDGWLDIFFSNTSNVTHIAAAQNRIYMNQGRDAGGHWLGFIEETRGDTDFPFLGPRLPGLLNRGPFVSFDRAFRSDVGDIDADGDIDIIVCLELPVPLPQTAGVPQQSSFPSEDSGNVIVGGSDGDWTRTFLPYLTTRVLINDGNGFFIDDSLGADSLFGGRPRIGEPDPAYADLLATLSSGESFILPPFFIGPASGSPEWWLNLEQSPDRDRIPPALWDYSTAVESQEDYRRESEVVLGQFGGDQGLDIYRITHTPDSFALDTPTEGQENLLVNIGGGYFANVTFGDPPPNPNYFIGERSSDFFVDPDISDVYFGWHEVPDDSEPPGGRERPVVFSGDAGIQIIGGVAEAMEGAGSGNIYPAGMIGVPDGGPFDQPIETPGDAPERNQIPALDETDSFGAAAADIDNSGDPDLVVANMSAASSIYTMARGTNVNNTLDGIGVGGVEETFLPLFGLGFVRENEDPNVPNDPFRVDVVLSLDQTVNSRAREVALGDVDNDGDPDAYFAIDGTGSASSTSSPAIDRLYLNDGGATGLSEDVTDTRIIDPEPLPTFDVELADIDNDGDLDALVAIIGDRNIYLENFLINSPTTPTVPGDPPLFFDATDRYLINTIGAATIPGGATILQNTTTAAAWGDFDNNGLLDIYIGNGLQSAGDNNVLEFNMGSVLNDGVPIFKLPHAVFPAPIRRQGRADFTNEGFPDANSDGSPDSDSATTPTTDVVVADFDNDSDPDVFVTNDGFRNSLLLNVGARELGPGQPYRSLWEISSGAGPGTDPTLGGPLGVVDIVAVYVTPEHMVDSDMIGDGLLIDTTGVSLPGPTVTPSPIGDLRPGPLDDPALEFSRAAAVGDFDGDGWKDIFVANGIQGGFVRNVILHNLGASADPIFLGIVRFEALNPDDDSAIIPDPADWPLNVRNSFDAAVCDLDDDGDLDIYVADAATSEITVRHIIWENISSGPGNFSFDLHQITIPGLNGLQNQYTTDVLIGDFDNDGDITEDINGDGILDEAEDILAPYGVPNVISDMPGMRRDFDILLCNYRARDLLLINEATETDPLTFETMFVNRSDERMPTEDRNENNILDEGEDSDGDGSIGAVIRNSFHAAATDVDHDGDLDIVIAQDNPNPLVGNPEAVTVQLLINNTMDGLVGVFSDQTDHEIGTTAFNAVGNSEVGVTSWNGNSRTVSFADVDNDMDADLFIGNIGLVGTGLFAGAYNVLMINNLHSENLNALTDDFLVAAGARGGPLVKRAIPPSAAPVSQLVRVTLRGLNFQAGATAQFGEGTSVLGVDYINSTSIVANVAIDADAVPGPRTIVVENPDGTMGASQPGAFAISTLDPDFVLPEQTAVERTSWTMYR